MINLYIDTTDPETVIGLISEEAEFIDKTEWASGRNQTEELLVKINLLLKKNKIGFRDLGKIIVVSGPGSYTGLRVGVSTANALSFALRKPIATLHQSERGDMTAIKRQLALSSFKPVKPVYNRPPHITTPKDRQAG